jgi:hypothetical protein
MASGVIMGLVTIGIGPIYEALGPQAYFVMAGAGVVALFGAFMVGRRWHGEVLAPEEDGLERQEEHGN